ncbi:MAG: hypothetical protein EXS13_11005 [Planctomycetes bacterium]|nr:hypothetical protein [Planctomycetota bacterium]
MNRFATLIWKEWRGERRSIVTLALAAALVPCLGLVIARQLVLRFGGGRYTYDDSTATIVAHLALLAVALTVGAELVPRESHRGSIALLRRLPCGLLRAFAAKLVLLLLAASAIALLAWLSACVAIGATGGPWFPRFLINRSFIISAGAPSLLLIAVLGGFTVAASTWLSRATLALPAAVLALALAALPVHVITERFPGLLLLPRELETLLWIGAVAAPIVAALSFVLGRRHGGTERRSLAVGLLAMLALSLPAYGWMSHRIAEWGRIDPEAETFRFTNLPFDDAMSDDGRFAYLTIHHEFGSLLGSDRRLQRAGSWACDGDGPTHPLQIDVADGSWREIGTAGSIVMAPKLDWVAMPARYVMVAPFDGFGCELANDRVLLDARRGVEVAKETIGSGRRPFADRSERIDLDRAYQSCFLPDGRQVWLHRGEFVTETADGSIRVLPDSSIGGDGYVPALGLGVWLPKTVGSQSVQSAVEIYDLARERRYPKITHLADLRVRSGKWIGRSIGPRPTRIATAPRWQLFDPDTGATTPAPDSVATDELFWFDDDGAALGGRNDALGRVNELFRINPELGTRERIALPPWLTGGVYKISLAARTLAGTPIVRVVWVTQDQSPTSHFARWDRTRRELRFAGDADTPQMEAIGCPDDETLLAIEGQRRLVRLRFGSAAREVVFPKPQATSEAPR